jgi:hypothetical protein
MRETIENLRRETETTLRVLYALKQFRLFISKKDSVDKINTNPDFWRIFEVSVRTNLFIGIRRLYEGANDTFNFQQVINKCRENIDVFSADSLRNRKMLASSNAIEWIDTYMADVYEPIDEDFKKLAKIVRKNSKKMKGIYSEAASRIYAHAIHMDHAVIAKLTDKLSFDEMETALESIWHCYNQISRMYENGTKPVFEITKYPYKQEVYESLIKQLG